MNLRLNRFQLKLLAVIAMFIDHFAYVFTADVLGLETYLVMRAIGRLTMPIMAFFIAEGYYYTRDFNAYVLRLLVAAAVSVVPFGLALSWQNAGNIMLTLALGLLAIRCFETITNKAIQAGAIIALTLLSGLGDWSYFGVVMVLGFWLARKEGQRFNVVILTIFALLTYMAIEHNLTFNAHYSFVQIALGILGYGGACFFALPLIQSYNGQKGPGAQLFFYAFYPLHLLFLWGLSLIF